MQDEMPRTWRLLYAPPAGVTGELPGTEATSNAIPCRQKSSLQMEGIYKSWRTTHIYIRRIVAKAEAALERAAAGSTKTTVARVAQLVVSVECARFCG